MKILVVSKPRTRSTWFRKVLASYHQLPTFTYEDLRTLLEPRAWWTMPGQDNVDYLNAVQARTNEWVDKDYLVKIELQNFCQFSYSGRMINFDLLDLTRYDEIYILSRDSDTDCISSFYVSDTLDNWSAFTDSDFEKLKDIQLNPNLTNPDKSSWPVIQHIWTDIVLEKLKNYLEQKNKKYTFLQYEQVPSYINENFPGIVTPEVNNNIDYKKIIKDYNQIPDYIVKLTPVAYKLFSEQNN